MPRDYGAFRDIAGRDIILRDDSNTPGAVMLGFYSEGNGFVVLFRASKPEAERLLRSLQEARG